MLLIITIASVFTACKSDSSDLQTNKVMLIDSSRISNSSASSDTATVVREEARPVAVSREKTRTSTSTSNGGGNTASTGNGTTTSTTTTTTKKKGWSNRAKGAVIGGVAGAVGGAIASIKEPVQL